MAKFVNPILFSSYFKIDPRLLDEAALIDPFLNVDLELFIDPVLLVKSANTTISVDAYNKFRTHFTKFIRCLDLSKTKNDAPWKAARKLLDLNEPPENGLGYSGASRTGNNRPEEIRELIMQTAHEIISLGAKDPEMISLMGFFEEGVGPDTISDFTTRVIFEQLAAITSTFCARNGIATEATKETKDVPLPIFEDVNGKRSPFLLIPNDIVRDLPIANDWSDVQEAALANAEIRDRVNDMLAGIAQPTVVERKKALRDAALSSVDAFDHFLNSVIANATNYDPHEDVLGYFRLRELLISNLSQFQQKTTVDISAGPEAVKAVVLEALDLFKRHIEVGDLWRELWTNGKPKKERAAQLMFQVVADAYCKANNIDMSPEANMGGGPVDFKFSHGYDAKILVEIKRDIGTVKHGYETQLEHYKKAADSFFGIFVVIDYGKLGNKLETITKIRNRQLAEGHRASDIIVIDATPKDSASKKNN